MGDIECNALCNFRYDSTMYMYTIHMHTEMKTVPMNRRIEFLDCVIGHNDIQYERNANHFHSPNACTIFIENITSLVLLDIAETRMNVVMMLNSSETTVTPNIS